jgi:hypothetical protein
MAYGSHILVSSLYSPTATRVEICKSDPAPYESWLNGHIAASILGGIVKSYYLWEGKNRTRWLLFAPDLQSGYGDQSLKIERF